MRRATEPFSVHVVVPAHNEASLVGHCLASLAEASSRLQADRGVTSDVTVVLDRCSDETAAVARTHGVRTLSVDVGCVGRARDSGVRDVQLRHAAREPSRVWIAMTDADSVVPARWLVAQADAAAEGHELWLGPVRPDPSGLPEAVLAAWWRRHEDSGELSVYGANLGFSLSAYLRAGGFPPLAEHEDVLFVRAAMQAGLRWRAGDATVVTSARTAGRTPGGFAGYLRTLVAEVGS